jgi:hypothetical protein
MANMRQEIEELIRAGQWTKAAGRLAMLWEREANPALAGFVAQSIEKNARLA